MKNGDYELGDKVIVLVKGEPAATGKVDFVGRDVTVQIDGGVREVFERDELRLVETAIDADAERMADRPGCD